jgi:hypothetical protein
MKLQLFPKDTQTCKLEIESYGYSTTDIDYFWGVKRSDKTDEAVAFGEFTLPQFKRAGYRVNSTNAVTSTGAYVGFRRNGIHGQTPGFSPGGVVVFVSLRRIK